MAARRPAPQGGAYPDGIDAPAHRNRARLRALPYPAGPPISFRARCAAPPSSSLRTGAGGRELATARWGMPSSQHALMEAIKKRAVNLEAKGKPVDFKEMLRMEPDDGITNIRNVKSKHWTRWLGVENRCVVPFNSFSEFNKAGGRRRLVSARREPAPRLLRRHLDQLGVGPEGQEPTTSTRS